jgi:hypothetical protein
VNPYTVKVAKTSADTSSISMIALPVRRYWAEQFDGRGSPLGQDQERLRQKILCGAGRDFVGGLVKGPFVLGTDVWALRYQSTGGSWRVRMPIFLWVVLPCAILAAYFVPATEADERKQEV